MANSNSGRAATAEGSSNSSSLLHGWPQAVASASGDRRGRGETGNTAVSGETTTTTAAKAAAAAAADSVCTTTASVAAAATTGGGRDMAARGQRQLKRRKSLLSAQLSELQQSLPAVFRAERRKVLATAGAGDAVEHSSSGAEGGEREESNQPRSSNNRETDKSREEEGRQERDDEAREKSAKKNGRKGEGEGDEAVASAATEEECSSILGEEELLAAEERERQQIQNYKAIFIPLDPVLSKEINCEILNTDIRKYPWKRTRFGDVYYSPRYSDDRYTYRHVILSRGVRKEAEKLAAGMPGNLLTEDMFMHCLGITLSPGWSHFMIFNRKLKELILRRPKEEPGAAAEEDKFKIDGAPGEGDEVDVDSDDEDFGARAAEPSACTNEDVSLAFPLRSSSTAERMQHLRAEPAAAAVEKTAAARQQRPPRAAAATQDAAATRGGAGAGGRGEEDTETKGQEEEELYNRSASQTASSDAVSSSRGEAAAAAGGELGTLFSFQQQRSARVGSSMQQQQGDEEGNEDQERHFEQLPHGQQEQQHCRQSQTQEEEQPQHLPENRLRRCVSAAAAAAANGEEGQGEEGVRQNQSAHLYRQLQLPRRSACDTAAAAVSHAVDSDRQNSCTQNVAASSRRENRRETLFLPLSRNALACSLQLQRDADQEQTSHTGYAPPQRPSSVFYAATATAPPLLPRSSCTTAEPAAVAAIDPIRAHHRRLLESVLQQAAASAADGVAADSAAAAASDNAAPVDARCATAVGVTGVVASSSSAQQQQDEEEDGEQQQQQQLIFARVRQQRQQLLLPPAPSSLHQQQFAADCRPRSRVALQHAAAAAEDEQQQREGYDKEAAETEGRSCSFSSLFGCTATAAPGARRSVPAAAAAAVQGGIVGGGRILREEPAEDTAAAAAQKCETAAGRRSAAAATGKGTADLGEPKGESGVNVCRAEECEWCPAAAAAVPFPVASGSSMCCSHSVAAALPLCPTGTTAGAMRTRSSNVANKQHEQTRSSRETNPSKKYKQTDCWPETRSVCVQQQKQQQSTQAEPCAAAGGAAPGAAPVASCAAVDAGGGGSSTSRTGCGQSYAAAEQPLLHSAPPTAAVQLHRPFTRHQQQMQMQQQQQQQQIQPQRMGGMSRRSHGSGAVPGATHTRDFEGASRTTGAPSAATAVAAAGAHAAGRTGTRKRCSVALSWEGEGEAEATDGRDCCSSTYRGSSERSKSSTSLRRSRRSLCHSSNSVESIQNGTSRCLRSSRNAYCTRPRGRSHDKNNGNQGDTEERRHAEDFVLSVDASSLRGRQRGNRTAAGCRIGDSAGGRNSEQSNSINRHSSSNSSVQRMSRGAGVGCSSSNSRSDSSRGVHRRRVRDEAVVAADLEEEGVRCERKATHRQKGAAAVHRAEKKELHQQLQLQQHQQQGEKDTSEEGGGGERKTQRRRMKQMRQEAGTRSVRIL